MIFGLGSIKFIAAALIIGLTVGFGSGYYTKAKFVKAEMVDEMVETRKGDAYAVQDSRARDEAIALKSDTVGANIDAVRQVIRKRAARATEQASAVQTVAPQNEAGVGIVEGKGLQLRAARTICFGDNLPIGDVRLFNLAFDGQFDRATLTLDATSEAASQVTGADFCAHVLDIAEQYHELAINHNALVDFVADLMRNQRARLRAE